MLAAEHDEHQAPYPQNVANSFIRSASQTALAFEWGKMPAKHKPNIYITTVLQPLKHKSPTRAVRGFA
jgi:hypothetical protein